MIEPPIEEVIGKAGGRFNLVLLASRRARQINSYYTQLGGGIGRYVPPQVHSLSHKPLTIALEEIAADKLRVGTGETTESQEPDTLDVLLSYQTEPLEEGDPVAGIETLGSAAAGEAAAGEPVAAEGSSEPVASDDSVEGTAVENLEDR
ncbi:MAG: DNA-directed RNA polymerase subunit omega [Acidimicrobiia bacterium]|nr:DNA-directed RNA polymerase subunit omega [Acidimicrobiia bacterium]